MSRFQWSRKKSKAEEGPQDAPQEPGAETPQDKAGLFRKLHGGLKKTRSKVTGGLRSVLSIGRSLDEELLEEIEEQLYLADIGPAAVIRLCGALRQAYKSAEIKKPDEVLDFLKARMTEELAQWDTALHLPEEGPGVIMVAGVNGSGKTTSIAKLAHMFVAEGRRVLLAASDTFRAAAVEQLEIWADRVGADIVKNESADPAAVAFDAADKALAQGYHTLIIDTAGRLHTRTNLMMELQKVSRVVAKKIPGAPHETLMVLDATTGQNAISQAIRFSESINLTGMILAKLDGTAKGGIVFGMRDQIDIPVKFVGVGERAEDLTAFDPEQFVQALFE
ncbi:MAG: signal recognition particle-docking protein FtsY [Candidatus Brocadiae bacterium]|nr:signal recognition particle-docking protein FtsY [Candidatus Brocadiia bacterium]